MGGKSKNKSIYESRKGQVSLEFLIVFALFLSLLIVAVAAMVNLKKHSDDSLADEKAILADNDISSTVNNICELGEGNSKTLDVGINNFNIEFDDANKVLFVEYTYMGKKHSVGVPVKCNVEADENPYDRNVRISYDDGSIKIEKG